MKITDEMIERIRHSGRVHGIEDFREELMKTGRLSENYLVIELTKLHDLVDKLERRNDDRKSN